MSLEFSCQRCKCKCSDTNYRVPGPHKMGRVLMEQYVCKACFDSHVEQMNAKVFAGVKSSDPTKCCMCVCNPDEPDKSLGPNGPYYAHFKPLVTGDWKTVPVCEGCFDDYHNACKECCGIKPEHGHNH